MKNKDEYYEAALKFCRNRGFEGEELPPYGSGTVFFNCPVARALNASVGVRSWARVQYPDLQFPLPMEVVTFIQRADSGHYPWLGEPHRPPKMYK